MFQFILLLVPFSPASPPPAPDLEAERVRIAVQVAIAIAKAKEVKPTPTPKVDPTPGVVVQPPFTQGGTATPVRRADAPNTGSQATYRMVNTPIPVLTTGQYGVIRCVSYG